jgi:ABC-2 type transport system ATP-binding protein
MSNEDIGKPVLEFRDIVKKYDGKNALDHLTLTVNKGDIYGFVGENGAGKSTAMRVLAGLIEVNSGEFLINGVSSTDPRIIEERKKMGAIIEQPALFHGFTAYDNLKMNLILSGQKPDPERIKSILERVGLKDLYNSKKKAGNFSLGMRQRLGIAMAFVNNVDILILDDSSSALDFKTEKNLRQSIKGLDKTLIVISQRASSVMHMDRIIVLDNGEIEAIGSHNELLEKSSVYKEICHSQDVGRYNVY